MYKFPLILLSVALSSATLMKAPGLGETFRQCLISYQAQNGLGRCFGVGAISRLQALDSNPEFDFVDGLTLSRDMALESIIDTFDHVFSKRAMRWDLNFIYPGLEMRVMPSTGPSGVLEFVMDPNHESAKAYIGQDIGTGKILARQFLVPLLLGLKFNVATIVPLIFGLVVLMAKKIAFISKVALIASTAFGLGSLLFKAGSAGPSPGYYSNDHSYYAGHQPGSFGGIYKGHSEEFVPQEHLQYRGVHVPMDELKLYGNLQSPFGEKSGEESPQKKGRNFAWNEDDKLMKKTR
ncbi:hypothetical protein D910_03720 [Dendroctonus ponderosae]|uniref:Protein osiris 10 n=2 Tax=Dendroctonus ponderosae TaxID=77166 RepID=U4TZR0_DENPD|nr:hypothetical protein D910_03720 [Dendroctonus ponderosae]KAH1017418.1 hypothetical protein HUJ05_008061 [Dendroctonus ponderosae]